MLLRRYTISLSFLLAAFFASATPAAAAPKQSARRRYVQRVKAQRAALGKDAKSLLARHPHLRDKATEREVAAVVGGRRLARDIAVLLRAARGQDGKSMLHSIGAESREYLRGYVKLVKSIGAQKAVLERVWLDELSRTVARRAKAKGKANSAREDRRIRKLERDVETQRSLLADIDATLKKADQQVEQVHALVGKGRAAQVPRKTPLAAKLLAGGQLALSTVTLLQIAGQLQGIGHGALAFAVAYLGYLMADVISAVGTPFSHFPLDAYFYPDTTVFDKVADKTPGGSKLFDSGPLRALKKKIISAGIAFQDHHDNPAHYNDRSFVHLTGNSSMFTVPMMAGAAALPPELLLAKALIAGLSTGLFVVHPSHTYSHKGSSQNNALVRLLQRTRQFIPGKEHGKHHHVPYPGNYAIVNGLTNKAIDKLKICRAVEGWLYNKLGVLPNTWKERGGAAVMKEALGADSSKHPKLPAQAYKPARAVSADAKSEGAGK